MKYYEIPNITTELELYSHIDEEPTAAIVIRDLEESLYHRINKLGSTDFKYLAKSYEHFKSHRHNPPWRSESMLLGSAVHDLFLMGEKYFHERYLIIPGDIDRRTKVGKGRYLELVKGNEGKFPIRIEFYEQVCEIIDRLATYDEVCEIHLCSEKEISIFKDIAKGRLDLWDRENNIIYDLKTTSDISKFHRKITDYLCQIASYSRLAESVAEPKATFRFLVVETKPPYETKVFTVSELLAQKADLTLDIAIDNYMSKASKPLEHVVLQASDI